MLFGILDLSLWGYVIATVLLTQFTIAAVTIYLHRNQAHKAVELHPLVSHVFRFWLWLTTGMRTKEWVAIHRKHHAKCETSEDPHSPQVLGLKKLLLEGAELYQQAAKNSATVKNYGMGTPDDWLERNIYFPWYRYGNFVMLAINLLLFGVVGLTIWAIQMMWIPIWAAGVVNGVGHYYGYRNYECKDAATNIVPWGVFIGGEELHNNHHTYPNSAKLSSKWWEFDMGWFYICLMSYVGLAKVKQVAPKPVIGPVKQVVDIDNLRAVIGNRFHVMARYSRDVLKPVVGEVLNNSNLEAQRLLKPAKKLLIRDVNLLSDHSKKKLQDLLDANEKLKLVYAYKQRLQDIWNRTDLTHENLLRSLQEWCKQAETAGVKALEDFALSIRRYTVGMA